MHYGVAAAKQALTDSGFEIDDANRTDVGDRLRLRRRRAAAHDRQLHDALEKGPNRGPADVHRERPRRLDVGDDRDRDRRDRAQHRDRLGLLDRAPTTSPRAPRRSAAATASPSITGSTEAPLLEVAHAGFGEHARHGLAAARRAARRPSRARSMRTRNGFVLGEGAGSLFLEDLELAKKRGAKIYAEVVGYGSAADGWDMIQPIEGGTGSARAMKMALERRGVPADEVDVINPHGTSTPARRRPRGRGDLGGLRRSHGPGPEVAGDLGHQVDDRPHDGRGRRLRGLRDAS